MTRTRISSLLLLAAIGLVVGGMTQLALASAGRPIVIAPITLPLALIAIGAIVVWMAVPIRRMTRGRAPAKGPVDPFFATRVVMLAKASALSGALLAGAGGGMLAYLLTRSVVPGVGSLASTIATIVGAVVLLTCGLVAEHMCRIPPDDDEDNDGQRPARARS
ncbi:DUF3180 domain-containing protein [Marisediminicola senii]|uniref:DUF3180 domain-containing protein n=1 Tax=Marisediminicola senii TaxID=2711233 RepID=UPI0013EAD88E|nr:DUF3180 domain-containing protein [Marisediminicola senii]